MTEREQMEKRQQILRELVEFGKKNGKITAKEINRAIDELELDSAQQDKFYTALEKMGVEIAMGEEDMMEETPLIESLDGDDFSNVEEIPEEELNNPMALMEGIAIDDPVRMYLKEIGKVNLLSSDEEIELAKRMLDGDEAAKKRLAEANLRLVVSIAKRYVISSARLPLGYGSSGHVKKLRKLLLCNPFLLSQFLQFFMKFHSKCPIPIARNATATQIAVA